MEMIGLEYIDEDEGLKLLLKLIESQSAKGVNFIRGPKWASIHCVGTAKKGRDLAMRAKLNENIQYAIGIFHDAGKLFEPDPFHEVIGAWYAITHGEEFGLVRGSSAGGRKSELMHIASCIIADGPVYEEWTNNLYAGSKSRYDEGFDGKEGIERIRERLEKLRILLSPDGTPLSLEKLLLPSKMQQKISLVADMADVNIEEGTIGGMKTRFKDILQRYEDPNHKDYNPVGAQSARMVMPRYYQIFEEVAEETKLRVVE